MFTTTILAHPWLVGFAFLITSYLFSTVLTIFKPGLRDIPGPFWAKVSRIWRFRTSLQGQVHDVLRQQHEKYGKIVRIGPNHVSVSDVAALQTIYGINSQFRKTMAYLPFNNFKNGKPEWNLFSTSDPGLHKHLKSGVASKYSLSSLVQMEYLVDEVSEVFVRKMDGKAGAPFDFGEWLQWFAFDAISNISFRQTLGFLETESDPFGVLTSIENMNIYADAIAQMPELHYCLVANPLFPILAEWIPAMKSSTAGFATTEKLAKEQIEAFDKNPEPGRGDFIEYLRGVQAKSPEKMSDYELEQTIGGNLTAGSDTTAVSLRAIFYYLMKTPRCYAKLQAEIDSAQDQGLLSELITYKEATQHIPYLQLVMKEALRLHPGIPGILERMVPPDAPEICGIQLPAGTKIGVAASVIHRDRSIYGPDADAFRPERWTDSPPAMVREMEKGFFTFATGTRSCIGKNIGYMEIAKFVPLLLRRYEVRWFGVGGSQEWKVETHTFARQTGMVCRLVPRQR